MAKRKSVFAKDYVSPYGTFEGARGSREDWRTSFEQAWTGTAEEARTFVAEDDGTPWSILEISADSDLATIKSAYRNLMMIHHPDHGGDPAKARKIMAAYFVLMENL
jgi:DnaJ-class molecular chaperone